MMIWWWLYDDRMVIGCWYYAWRATTSLPMKVFLLRLTIYDCIKVMFILPKRTAFFRAFATMPVPIMLFVLHMPRIGSLMNTSMFLMLLLYRMSPITLIFSITRRQCFHWFWVSIAHPWCRPVLSTATSIGTYYNWSSSVDSWPFPSYCQHAVLCNSNWEIILDQESRSCSRASLATTSQLFILSLLCDGVSQMITCFLSISMIPCMYPVRQKGL